MPEPAYTINLNASLAPSSSIGVGQFAVLSSGTYLPATAANRGTKRSSGIAISAASALGPSFVLQAFGEVAADISGLAAGTASWVRVSATGTAERVTTPGASDDVVGWCETSGVLHLACGVLGVFVNPGVLATGTGFVHMSAGAQDAAAKLVENADVHAAAAIAVSKLAAGAADTVLLSTPGYGKIVNANVDAAAAIVGSKVIPTFGAVDCTISDGYTFRVGGVACVSATAGTSTVRIAQGAPNLLLEATTGILASGPIKGSATDLSPWSGLNGEDDSIGMVDANYVATAAEYSLTFLTIPATTTFTANRFLDLPNASAAQAYMKFVDNQQAGAFVVEVRNAGHTGTTVQIAQGFGAWVKVSAAGVRRVGPDV